MSTQEQGTGGGDLIISGRVAALRELAAPAPLSEEQLRIVRWYGELVRLLSGPTSGDERGRARQPSWVQQGPRIVTVGVASDRRQLELVVEGSGFATTQEVLIDGRPIGGWEVASPGRLTIPISAEQASGEGPAVTLMIRTAQGDVAIEVQERYASGDE